MRLKLVQLCVLTIMIGTLVGCGSKDESGSDDSSGGGYIGCVLELTEAKRAGILSATDQEIQEECRSRLLP